MSLSERRMGWTTLTCLGLNVWLWATPAAAQPTQEQQSAIRSSCRSDYMSNCSSVKPGGIEALQCLQRNVAKLSPGCQSAVNAVSPRARATSDDRSRGRARRSASGGRPRRRRRQCRRPLPPCHRACRLPAPASAPVRTADSAGRRGGPASGFATADRRSSRPPSANPANRISCRAARAYSPAAPTRSAACNAIPRSFRRTAGRAVAALGGPAPSAVATAAPAAAPTLASAPTPEQQSAIKFTCRRDFMTNCRNVTPGGPEALACLQRNAARLSPDCRTSLAAVADGTPPPAATAAPAAAAPAARPGPVGPLRRATPRTDDAINKG